MSKYSPAAIAAGVIIGIPVVIGFSALGAYVFMLLWNWALVGIFPAVPILDFLEGLGVDYSFVVYRFIL
jgi:hypothetical protein